MAELPRASVLFARLVIEAGHATRDQVERCLVAQSRSKSGDSVDVLLVRNGFLTQSQADAIKRSPAMQAVVGAGGKSAARASSPPPSREASSTPPRAGAAHFSSRPVATPPQREGRSPAPSFATPHPHEARKSSPPSAAPSHREARKSSPPLASPPQHEARISSPPLAAPPHREVRKSSPPFAAPAPHEAPSASPALAMPPHREVRKSSPPLAAPAPHEAPIASPALAMPPHREVRKSSPPLAASLPQPLPVSAAPPRDLTLSVISESAPLELEVPRSAPVPAATTLQWSTPIAAQLAEPAPSIDLAPPVEVRAAPEPAAFVEPNSPAFVARIIAAPNANRSPISRELEAAERRGASDAHFHPGAPSALRIGGRLVVSASAPVEESELAANLMALLGVEEQRQLASEFSVDVLHVTANGLRCRGSFFRTHSGLNATFRLIRRKPPTLEEIGLPPQLAAFTEHGQGLLLVTGLAGSGKTTTLAALVNLIASARPDHVLCLEDPIEIVHPPNRALVNQRQVGRDTATFARALRGALREDPDVIVIGELRDAESISLAVTAAETGHLVLASMTTQSAVRTISRLVGAFPPGQQAQVRAMLAASLHGVITQKMVPSIDGQRAVALEVLVVTPAVGNLIRDDKLIHLRSVMQTGKLDGQRPLDESLRELVAAGRISLDEARRVAEVPATFTPGAPGAVVSVTPPSSGRPPLSKRP